MAWTLMAGRQLLWLIVNSVFIFVTHCSTDWKHFCQLTAKENFYLRYGFYTPAPNREQKYFIVVENYYCELEPIIDASQTQNHFGYRLTFKNKTCSQSTWFGPRDGNDYPSSAFAVANGLFWNQTLIGKTWFNKDMFEYSYFPIGCTQFPEDTPAETYSVLELWKDFTPLVSYVTYSKQNSKFVAFFYFNKSRERSLFDNKWKVYDFNDESQLKEVTSKVVDGNPNDFASDRTAHYYSIPRSLVSLKTSLKPLALFGIPLSAESNGTIILFRKENKESRFRYHYYYCVTEEHILSDACNSHNQSTDSLLRLIDCENEQLVTDEPQEVSSSTTSQVLEQSREKIRSSIVTWIVIIIVIFILLLLVLLIVWYSLRSTQPTKSSSKTDSNGADQNHSGPVGAIPVRDRALPNNMPGAESNEYLGQTRSKESIYKKGPDRPQLPLLGPKSLDRGFGQDTVSISSNVGGIRSKESTHSQARDGLK